MTKRRLKIIHAVFNVLAMLAKKKKEKRTRLKYDHLPFEEFIHRETIFMSIYEYSKDHLKNEYIVIK